MAQTTAAISAKDVSVAYSTDGTNFTDMSGYAGTVSMEGGEHALGEFYTFDGSTGITTVGKIQPITITTRIIYDETGTAPYPVLLPYWVAGSSVGIRWSPKGLISGTTGEWVYTTVFGNSKIVTLGYPGGEASSADPIIMDMTVRCASITTSTSTS
jgi:hypothetical protein